MPHKTKEAKNEYMKQYYQQNKEKRHAYEKQRNVRDKDKKKEYMKQYSKVYYLKHKEAILERTFKYKNSEQGKLTRQARKNGWLLYLKETGKDKCSICGYNKCWQAIEFHHINPAEKETIISKLLIRKITEERKKEVEKCIALCANCHRELHFYSSREE